MSQVTTKNEVLDVIDKNGRLFLKTFLIDDTTNKLGWKMNPDSLDKYINSAIGRPAILNAIHYHPLEFNHIKAASFEPFISAQEPYRVGTIKQIYPATIPHSYDALIEITDPRLVEAYHKGELKIPRYVSPAVYDLHPSDGKEINDYEFLHLAFVDEPAYGIIKANVKGECHGTEQTCMNHLAQAAEIPTCNICPVAEFNKFQNTIPNSSYLTSNTQKEHSTMNDNTTESKPVEAPNSQPTVQTEVKPTPTVAETKVETGNEKGAPIQVVQPPNPEVTKEEVKPNNKVEIDAAELQQLREHCESFKATLAELKADKEAREKAEAEHKEHTKRELIEKYVTPDSTNGNEEERERRIKAFMNIPIEELEYFLQTHYILPESPCNQAKVKQAGVNRRVTDYSKKEVPATDNISQVKQAGILDEDIQKAKRLMQFFSVSSQIQGSRFN